MVVKSIVLIGDSIRIGYQDTVRSVLDGWGEVWAPDQNGGTSVNVLDHFDEWIVSRQPDILHVNCGLHDLKKDFGQDVATVPPDRYADNVRQILMRAQNETGATIVWALTTPVNQDRHHRTKGFDRFEADVVAYNKVATGIAGELGVAVNDLHSAVCDEGRDGLLVHDGVHFSPRGYAFLGQMVADCIKRLSSR